MLSVSSKSGHAFKQANCLKVVETFLSAGFGGPSVHSTWIYLFLFYDWGWEGFGWGLGGVTLIEHSGILAY